jgi:hypothetical protein
MLVMSTLTFDTYHFVERLEKAGMPREQAAAFAEAQKESLAEALDSGFVTQSDLFQAKSELKADIVRLKNRIDGMGKDMQSMELRLVIKLGAFFTVAVGILVAFMRMPH